VGCGPGAFPYGALPVTAATMWIGTAGLLVVVAPVIRAQAGTALRPATWLAVVYSGALSIATAYLLVGVPCLRQIGSTRTVVATNATPLVALALAWATLGEMPSPLQVVGAVGIVAGSPGPIIGIWFSMREEAPRHRQRARHRSPFSHSGIAHGSAPTSGRSSPYCFPVRDSNSGGVVLYADRCHRRFSPETPGVNR
jgi:uncharacterized membrane protein